MPALLVHFYNPVLDNDGVLNKLVALADPPYCHCELEFGEGKSCAVYLNGKTHVKIRSFDPNSYDTVSVTCSNEQKARALELALQFEADGQAFSKRAMLASKFARVPTPDAHKFTCCSKLCCELLQAADALPPDLSAARLTPSALHAALSARRTLVCDSTVIDFRPD
jgi:hypothetical protein